MVDYNILAEPGIYGMTMQPQLPEATEMSEEESVDMDEESKSAETLDDSDIDEDADEEPDSELDDEDDE